MLATTSTRILLSTLAAASLTLPHLAAAQSPDDRLTAIEQQIRALNEELRRVRRELAARDAAVQSAQSEAARARREAQQAQASVTGVGASRGGAPRGSPRATPDAGAGPAGSPATAQAGPVASGQPGSTGPQQSSAVGPKGTFHLGGVTVTLGGFVEATGIYRSRNMVTDIATPWNAIPFATTALNHESEFRATARQSRVSLLASADIDATQRVQGYGELDLQGSAPTANSNESNSYNPRLRQAYATYDNTAIGVHALAGQAWSLATMNRSGITPRGEDVPLTIDAQYVPGFTWTRQPQLRVAKDLMGGRLWLAASLENPQTVYYAGGNGTGVATGTVNYQNLGVSNLNTTANYSDEIAPDLIVKLAADPGFGHYELYGLARFPHDRVSVVGGGHNDTKLAGGVGGGVILPVVPKMVDLELRGLAGYGIGRYGSSQLPDATISRTGAPAPLPEVQLLLGIIGHPTPAVDLYTYVGTEQIGSKTFNAGGKAYGYGNPLYSNAGCDVELSAATCTANTAGIVQGTLGGWWRFLQGDYGTVQAGAQYSYTRRSIFKGTTVAGSNASRDTDLNMGLVSLRYLPFQ